MSGIEVNDVLERLCNLLRMETRTFGQKYGVQPGQMDALTYLTQCNRYSNTPQAVGEYLGLTKGTISQSLKVLARIFHEKEVVNPFQAYRIRLSDNSKKGIRRDRLYTHPS